MKVNLTPIQVIALTLVVLGAISGGGAQLTELVGKHATQMLVAFSGLATTVLSGWIMIITGQSALVRNVQDMPGVEKITVNARASEALAQLAVAPENAKIEAAPGADAAVAETAKGT